MRKDLEAQLINAATNAVSKAIKQIFAARRSKGGKTAQAQRTPEERSEAGRKAVAARWGKKK